MLYDNVTDNRAVNTRLRCEILQLLLTLSLLFILIKLAIKVENFNQGCLVETHGTSEMETCTKKEIHKLMFRR